MRSLWEKTVNFLAFFLLLASALTASGQVGAPSAAKPAQGAPEKAPPGAAQRFESQGIAVDFSVDASQGGDGKGAALTAGADAVATFRVTDAHTNQPLTGLHPAAWISTRVGEHAPNDAECKDKIRTFMGGLLSARADIDLNGYQLLTLNHDNTITFIDPQVSFSKTKLEAIVVLPGAGADWALSKDKDLLYVSIPDLSQVAVVNTITKKTVATVETGAKTRPVRVAVQPDGRYVWVGLDGSPRVAVIEAATGKLVKTVEVGAGLHTFAFTGDSRFAYVTNSEADTVSAVDAASLAKAADIPVGKTPVPAAYSPASKLIYVASVNGGGVSVIDPSKQQVVKSVALPRGLVALRFDPTGRFGFVVNQLESKAYVLDASTNTLAGDFSVAKSPDQVTFTRGYAYFRGTESEKFTLIDVSEVAKGKFGPIDVQAGQTPASVVPAEVGVADMIVPTPEGNSVMVGSTSDQMVYYYVEGMMAPMGTLSNYKRRPHGLMVIDRSLAEVAPGVYSAPVKLGRAGRFDVPVLFDQPRLFKCFQLEVAGTPDAKPAGVSVALDPLFKGQRFKPGEAAALRFRITDSVTQKPVTGLRDVEVMAFEPPGVWQQRQFAREVGEGVYEVSQLFPRVALYEVTVRVASRGAGYSDLPITQVPVVNQAAAGETKNTSEKGRSNDE